MRSKKAWLAAAAAVLLTLCGVIGWALLRKTSPTQENRSYNLSFRWEGEAMPEDWVYDQKGWSVFVQEGDTPVLLTPNGFGGFWGDIQPGQTLYFSRVLEEDLTGDAILQLHTYEENVAVFLDDQLIFTTCPEQEVRIGYLTLPSRQEPSAAVLTVNLPRDSQGKTLTIAQSTASAWDVPEVWPITVRLICQAAFENELIGKILQAAVPAAALLLGSAALVLLFLGQLGHNRRDWGLLPAALSLLLWMAVVLLQSSVSGLYAGQSRVNWVELCKGLSLTALLGFLTSRAGRFRSVFWVVTGLTGLSCLLCPWLDLHYEALTSDYLTFLRFTLPQMTEFLSLCAFFVCAWVCWRGKQRFYTFFAPLSLAAVCMLALGGALKDGKQLVQQLELAVRYQTPAYFLWPLTLGTLAVALLALGMVLGEQELERRTRVRLISERGELTMSHYESLRAQNEQVMMLLHDMNKHFTMLRQMTGEERTRRYLDELLRQNEKIRPVIQSGNDMLDVIINGKLTQAINAGVRIELVRTHAPGKLPLTDMELCSLVMNLMDNAVAGVLDSHVQEPYIKLDIHTKNGFFVFFLENSARMQLEKKKPVPEHGLGLKIVGQIVERCEGLLETEQDEKSYRVTLALPLANGPDAAAAGSEAQKAGTC